MGAMRWPPKLAQASFRVARSFPCFTWPENGSPAGGDALLQMLAHSRVLRKTSAEASEELSASRPSSTMASVLVRRRSRVAWQSSMNHQV